MTEVPLLPRRDAFARELTPTWLSTTALLNGERPHAAGELERYVHLGCGTGTTTAVVAANHPHTEVWAWDPRPEHLAATRRLAAAAGLTNVRVSDQLELPLDLGGSAADVIVVQDVLAEVDDAHRARIAAAVRSSLRPGGLLCLTYPTLVGWSEIAPVQVLLRRLADGREGPLEEVVPAVLQVAQRLSDGGARFLTDRPVVAAWIAALADRDPAEVSSRFLRGPFRPLSPAQVAAGFVPSGCHLLGSARLTDDLDRDLPAALVEAIAGAPTRTLRETYRDLATRRSHRIDVFRHGSARLVDWERDERLADLGLASLVAPDEAPAAEVARDAWRELTSYGVVAGDLHADVKRVGAVVRILMEAGQVHPTVTNGPRRRALEACEALNAELSDRRGNRWPEGLRAVALVGSAVTTERAATLRAIPIGHGSAS